MNTTFKMASLAALTAATLALPAAAADMPNGQAKCQPKMDMSKCSAKCAGKCSPKKKAKHKTKKNDAKCAAKCAPKN